MSTSAREVRFDDSTMWVELVDGRTLGVPLAWFPRLLLATPEQRAACDIGRYGLHWEAIDEDISVEGLLAGRGDMTRRSRLQSNALTLSGCREAGQLHGVPARHLQMFASNLTETAKFQGAWGYSSGSRVAAPAPGNADAVGHSGTKDVPMNDPRVWPVAMLALWRLKSCH